MQGHQSSSDHNFIIKLVLEIHTLKVAHSQILLVCHIEPLT